MSWRWCSFIDLLRQQQHLQTQLSACNININCMYQLRKYSRDEEGNLRMWYKNDLPLIEVPLPSRKEMCQFTLKPITDSVARFCKNIECEDKGAKIVYLYSTNGKRIAGSTSMQQLLLRGNFILRINDLIYNVEVPWSKDFVADLKTDGDIMQNFDDLRSAVASLYAIMNIEEHKAFRERTLTEEYENVQAELKSLIKHMLRSSHHSLITYIPISTTNYNDHKRRAMSLYFHKKAAESNFDISRFNELQSLASSLTHDFQDPLYKHLLAIRLASK